MRIIALFNITKFIDLNIKSSSKYQSEFKEEKMKKMLGDRTLQKSIGRI